MSWATEWASCTNKKNTQKKEQHHHQFLWDMLSIQTHWLVNMGENKLIALEEQHPLELHPYLRSPPDHGSWDKWDMAASTASPLLRQPREPLLIHEMEVNSVTSNKQLLILLKWLSDSSYIFQKALRGLSVVPGITGVKVLNACHPGSSSHHWWWMQRRALFNNVPTLRAELCHGMKSGDFISKAHLAIVLGYGYYKKTPQML